MDREMKRRGAREPRRCEVPGCGRPVYARELCQTHHRQMLTTGKVKPIRPYRKRSGGTVKFAGFRLSQDCAGKIRRRAAREGVSNSAALTDVLEEWVRRYHSRG